MCELFAMTWDKAVDMI